MTVPMYMSRYFEVHGQQGMRRISKKKMHEEENIDVD